MSLRENILAKKTKRADVVTPSFLTGTDTPSVEVRVMTVRERSVLIDASTDENGDRDPAVFIARVVIETCYVPGTDDKVFTAADQDVLADMPSDVLDELAEPALRINGLMIGAVQVAEKN